MSYVWEHSSLKGTELLCLLAISDFADDQGIAYPAVATIAKKIRMSERNTHYLLSKLVESGELKIDRNAGPRGCNLFRVQSLQGVQPVAGGGATGSTKGVQPIAPEPSLNRQRTVNNYKGQAIEVLQFLNSKTGRNYQAVEANLSMISARLKEGSTVDDCRAVIAMKCREWGKDEVMSEYLRPATLFNATKFAQYRGKLADANP